MKYYFSRITHLHLLPFFAILGNCCVLHTTKRDSLILRSVSTLASYIFIWKIMKKRETGHGKCWTFFFICRTGFFVRKYGGTLHKDRIYNYIWCTSNVFIPIRFYDTIALDIDFEGRNSLGMDLERSNIHYLFSFLLFQCQIKELSFVIPMYTFHFMENGYLFTLIFNFQEKKKKIC